MVILFNFKRRRFFGYTWLLVRMTRKQDFLKALSEIRSNTPLSISEYGSKWYVRLPSVLSSASVAVSVRHAGSGFYCVVSLASMVLSMVRDVHVLAPRAAK